MILLLLALQAAPTPVPAPAPASVPAAVPAPTLASTLPPAFVEQTAGLATASVVSGFCLSLGWRAGSAESVEAELDRLSSQHGVSGSDARILVLRQIADAGEVLKARLAVDTSRPPDQASRLAFLDQVDAYARTACAETATAFPGLFAGDIATNQALVEARIAAVRQQILSQP